MELYAFGFNGHSQLSAESATNGSMKSVDIATPQKILGYHSIDIVWASWCDLLLELKHSDTGDTEARYLYKGAGLDALQIEYIKQNSGLMQGFFGAPLSDGLSGIVHRGSPSRITFFDSEQKADSDTPSIEIIEAQGNYRIQHVSVTSGGNVSVVANQTRDPLTPDIAQQGCILQFDSLYQFRAWLRTSRGLTRVDTDPFPQCKQLISNATTTTALTPSGQVYTWTRDPRFPKCLGRLASEEEPSYRPLPIPYLSESKIVRIAAGGYMAAAISEDGELFVWGQTCPGTEGEIRALESDKASDDTEEQDEFVRCVPLLSSGREGRATDVAIGCGHLLVAVEFGTPGVESSSRAVLGIGQAESGQLGLATALEFLSDWSELQDLEGGRVICLAAAGWSSWVVTESAASAT